LSDRGTCFDKNMKISKYIDVNKCNIGYVLFHGLNGSMVYCDEQTGQRLSEGKMDGINEDIKQKLKDTGFITTGKEEKELFRKLENLIEARNNPVGTAMFIPSYNCNFRCPYCFEKWRLENGKGWLEQVMTRKQADLYFEYYNLFSHNREWKSVFFYGGEPFLAENRDIITYICDKASALGATEFFAISNGYCLDQYIDIIKQFKKSLIQITLDGVGDAHDRTRFLKNGEGSYEKIAENISLALENGIRIRQRANIDENNVDQVTALKKESMERGWADSRFFSQYFAKIDYDKRENNAEFDEDNPFLKSIREDVKAGKEPAFGNRFCGGCGSSWIMDPFGDVYSCMEFVGMKDHRMFNISEEGVEVFSDVIGSLQKRRSNLMEKCRDCRYVFVCKGGCPAKAERKYGSLLRESCDSMPEFLQEAFISVANENLEGCKVKEASEKGPYFIPLTTRAK